MNLNEWIKNNTMHHSLFWDLKKAGAGKGKNRD